MIEVSNQKISQPNSKISFSLAPSLQKFLISFHLSILLGNTAAGIGLAVGILHPDLATNGFSLKYKGYNEGFVSNSRYPI